MVGYTTSPSQKRSWSYSGWTTRSLENTTNSYAWIVFLCKLGNASSNILTRSFLRLGSISNETSNAIKNLSNEFEGEVPVFNKERAKLYSFNEVYLEAPKKETKVAGDSPAKHKYVRLDSYDPQTGEIVSRKYTQLSEVSEETAIRYLKELSDKYSPGSIIADVPSNKTGLNKDIFKANNGNILKGQMILEVPVQKADIPPNVLEFAKKNDIIIRDVNKKNYK